MHQRKKLRGSKRPAVFKDTIVDVLQAQSGKFAEDVEIVEHILQIHQANVPGAVLLPDDGLKRGRRGAMAASRIEENEIDGWSFCHGVVYPPL